MDASARPPIVLLHGCGGSPHAAFVASGWVEAIEAAGRRAIALDLPGHGRGAHSHDPADYTDLTGDLIGRLPDGRFDAVGFSLGAKLLIEVALREPGRIRRMVLGGIGDNVFAPEAIGEAAARALEQGATAETPPPVRAFLATWEPERNDALAIAAILRRPPNPLFTEKQLAALDLPILIVNGGADPVGAIGNRLFDALKSARLSTIPGVGHFDLPTRPEFIEAALAFLAVEPASTSDGRPQAQAQ